MLPERELMQPVHGAGVCRLTPACTGHGEAALTDNRNKEALTQLVSKCFGEPTGWPACCSQSAGAGDPAMVLPQQGWGSRAADLLWCRYPDPHPSLAELHIPPQACPALPRSSGWGSQWGGVPSPSEHHLCSILTSPESTPALTEVHPEARYSWGKA